VKAAKDRQAGVTLFTALIMLVAITLLALSALNSTTTNLRVVGNMQSRSEALNAAQQAIETAISSPRFFETPDDALPEPCGAPNTLCTDLNGDGAPEYVTRLDPAPACVSARVIKTSELNLARAEDLGCSAARGQRGSPNGNSLCADTRWEITAESSSTYSGTKVTVTQGVELRVGVSDAEALCGAASLPASQGARSATTGRSASPVIAQKRRRTYWYIHTDQ
jgi:PilX N-terminal